MVPKKYSFQIMYNTEVEHWRPIPGFPEYLVSNEGNIMSIKYGKSRLLRPALHSHGYLAVGLCKNGKCYTKTIHRLVYEAFNGPIPKGLVINHIDENKVNNNIENLEAITQKENTNHGTGIKRAREVRAGLRESETSEKHRKYRRKYHKSEKYLKYKREYNRECYYSNLEKNREYFRVYRAKKRKEKKCETELIYNKNALRQ